MFALSQLEHRLRVPASKLDLPLEDAIRGELESIFLDKVIAKLGLCVSVYDIKSVDGGFVLPNEGSPTFTVIFRLIMFRPFVGEVIGAKLKESTIDGLRLTIGFFDDIYIPAYALPDISEAEPVDPENPKQVSWVWKHQVGDLPIEEDVEIRFQVSSVSYPVIPLEQEEGAKPFAPMVVTGSLDSDGLGPIVWW